MSVSQRNLDQLDMLLQKELEKNNSLIATLTMYKEIVEKKDFDFINMTDQERLNGSIIKGRF